MKTTTYVAFIEEGCYGGFTSKDQWDEKRTQLWQEDIDSVVEFEGPSFPEPELDQRESDRVFDEVKRLAKEAARRAGFEVHD